MKLPLLHTLNSLLVTCSRRVSRAARRLRPGPLPPPPPPSQPLPRSPIPRFLAPRRKKIAEEKEEEEEEEGEEKVGVWRREILMGEKCQPLDFSGVIYYDSDGRRLDAAPAPRSPLRSPLPSRVRNGLGLL